MGGQNFAGWAARQYAAIKQSAADAARGATDAVTGADLPSIAQGVDNVNAVLYGPLGPGGGPGAGAFVRTSNLFQGGLPGAVKYLYDQGGEVKADINDLQTNPTYGTAALASNLGSVLADVMAILSQISDITPWFTEIGDPPGVGTVLGWTLSQFCENWYRGVSSADAVGLTFGQYLTGAGTRARNDLLQGMTRTQYAPMFLVCYNGDEGQFDSPGWVDLRSVDPSEQNPGETDLAFLNRVEPYITWVANFQGTPFVGFSKTQSDGGTWLYYYVPTGVSPYPFMRLFDYVPSSGGFRNSITDLMVLLTTIPFHY